MPFISKSNNRQTGTPSPTPGDFLNTLLIVKDTVNATLLSEHTRLSELSNALSDVDNQLREAVEVTIKNLKSEYEKRKRKAIPGIKKLQDSLKSLSKSESKCKASERHCKNADAKKAKRRIKDANKALHEFTSSEMDFGVSTFVADQITLLCQQLMKIPPKLNSSEAKENSYDIQPTERSDSDSEGSSRMNTPTNHEYAEIDVFHARNSNYLNPRRSTWINSSEHDNQIEIIDQRRLVSRLNSVVLFSSDSEDDYGFGDITNKRPKSAGNGKRKSRSNKKSTKKSKSPDYEILNKPKSNDLFRRSGSMELSMKKCDVGSTSPVVYDEYEKPVKRETESLEAPIKEYIKRMSPSNDIENFNKDDEIFRDRLSNVTYKKTTKNEINDFTLNDDATPSNTRTMHKRFLPATPKHSFEQVKENSPFRSQSAINQPKRQTDSDQIDAAFLEETTDSFNLSTANNTVELLNAAHDFLYNDSFAESSKDNEKHAKETTLEEKPRSEVVGKSSLENDYIDLEEIKFRETVRSARREIIDKLKSKYVHSSDISLPMERSDRNNENGTNLKSTSNDQVSLSTNALKEKYNEICSNVRRSGYEKQESNDLQWLHSKRVVDEKAEKTRHSHQLNNTAGLHAGAGVYKSRLVHTYDTGRTEYESNKGKTPTNVPQSLVSSTIKLFEKASTKDHQNHSQVKKHKPVVKYGLGLRYRSASEPRTSVSSLKENTTSNTPSKIQQNKALQPRVGIKSQISSELSNGESDNGEGSNLAKSCTENDLLNLVRSETPSSIRRQWSKRRSSSVDNRVSGVNKLNEPTYEYLCSFSIPEQKSKCFISAIVVLDDRSVILLDELNSCLHLYDRAFKHKDQYRLLDKPRGCVQVNYDTVAVSFPYKKFICTFCTKMGAILSGTEMSVPCREWIVDIAFSKHLLYVLCKAGDIHVLTQDGTENNCIQVGMSGKLFIPPSGKRIFVLGEGRVSKFNTDGIFLSSKADIEAHSMIFLENRTYVADRQKHKLVPMADSNFGQNLLDIKIEYPTAVSSTINGDIVIVSQFEESMDVASTSTLTVLRLKRN